MVQTPEKPEQCLQEHILRASAGPLAEAHIVILRELLSLYPNKAEYAQYMGMRYAEKCDFEESHRYFQVGIVIEMSYYSQLNARCSTNCMVARIAINMTLKYSWQET